MTAEDLILDNLRQQRSTGSYCDVKLIIGKQYAWAHSSIVCPLSALISRQYNITKHKTKKNNSSVKIKLGGKADCDCFECLDKLLDFIYGMKPELSKDHSSHIMSYCLLLKLSKTLLNIISKSLENDDLDVICNESDILIKSELNDDSNDKEESNANDDMDYDESDKEESDRKPALEYDNPCLKFPTGKTHNCIGCNFKSYKTNGLLSHVRETGHGGNVCSLCWMELESENDLKDHFILHQDPMPFFCSYCDSRFRTRSLLGQHLPSHMFQKPFICPHCQKGFTRKQGLNCHLITHSNQRKHLCDECGFSSTYARVLKAHKLIHGGELFKCPFPGCTKTSTRKENIKQHYETHSNEKHFVCELCGHKFTQVRSLRRHMIIHDDTELGNICPHCPFRSRRVDNLRSHIARQHTNKSKSNLEMITIEPDVKNIIEPTNSTNSVPDAKRLKLHSYQQ